MNIIINPDIKNLIPPLSKEEYEGLKESLLFNGQFDLIKTGYVGVLNDKTEHFIIDGHNRKNILEELGRVPEYDPCSLEFSDLDSAKIWVINFQLGRRNLPAAVRGELVLVKKAIVEQQAKQRMSTGGAQHIQGEANLPQARRAPQSRDILAQEAGISGRTLDKLEKVLKEADEETKADLRADKLSIDAAYRKTTDIGLDPPNKTDEKIKHLFAICEYLSLENLEGRLKPSQRDRLIEPMEALQLICEAS